MVIQLTAVIANSVRIWHPPSISENSADVPHEGTAGTVAKSCVCSSVLAQQQYHHLFQVCASSSFIQAVQLEACKKPTHRSARRERNGVRVSFREQEQEFTCCHGLL